MKKIYLVALLALFSLASEAQIVSSRSSSVIRESGPVTPSSTLWFIRAGLSFDNIGGSDAEDNKSTIGYDVNVGFQRSITSLNGAYWGMDFGMMSRACKYDSKYLEGTWMAHAVQFSPFTFGWKIDLGTDFALDPHVGVYASYDLFGSSPDDNHDWDENLNKLDIGGNFGFGVWYRNRLNIEFHYRQGFLNMSDRDKISFTANKFVIALGLAF